MTALKAHVVNRRIVVDEPVDLPDGVEVLVYLCNASADAMSAKERAALERASNLAQADERELVEADEALLESQRRLVRDYAAGRADVTEILADLETAQLELLHDWNLSGSAVPR